MKKIMAKEYVKALTKEQQENIICSVDILYGLEIDSEEDQKKIDQVKATCEKYLLLTECRKVARYCCSNYHEVSAKGYLLLSDLKKFREDIAINLDISYRLDGTFRVIFDNTYC